MPNAQLYISNAKDFSVSNQYLFLQMLGGDENELSERKDTQWSVHALADRNGMLTRLENIDSSIFV